MLKRFRYFDAKTREIVEFEAESVDVIIDRDSEEGKKQAESAYHQWGGGTILRLIVQERGMWRAAFVSARISGDSRAGSHKGVHLEMECRDVRRSLHVAPKKGDAEVNP